jgi:hypothetical protein
MTLIDQIMPAYDRREVHSRATAAPPTALWEAIHELRAGELRAMRVLMGDGDSTVLEGFRRMGFRKIAEDPGRELVVAGIGRFWTLSGGLRRVESPEHFTGFEEPN